MTDKWLEDRLDYIRGLKSPSEHQRLLLMLAEKKNIDLDDTRKIAALVKAEKATERMQKARASVARIVNAEKLAERKRRDRELYQSAGLLILAGLVDTKTGIPVRDRGELLGALLALAKSEVSDEKRAEWKRQGDALLASKSDKKRTS